MANTIRIKRRADGSGAGAPSSLANAELAFNEQTDILYYGEGTGGAGGTATTVLAIGGFGAFMALSGTQNIAGDKTFTGTITVPTPTLSGHAANKGYVDTAISGVVTSFTAAGDSGSVSITNGNTLTISGGTALTSIAAATDTVTINLDNTAVNPGTYGTATAVGTFTVDQQGRLTAASNTNIAIPTSQIPGFTEDVQDIVGGMVSTNTESGISVTYDDTNGKLDFDVADFTITLGNDLSGSATVTNLGNVTLNATIQPNSVALGTDTTGNYVQSITGSGGITVSNGTPAEGATPNITIDTSVVVTQTGIQTLTNKTLTDPTINAQNGTIILPQKNTPDQVAEGSIVWDIDSDLLTVGGSGSVRKTMVDTDSTQTLTNKTLTSPTITGVSPTLTITGDVDGSGTFTNLGNATVNVVLDTVNTSIGVPGTFGSATAIPVVTVNGKGLVTAISTQSISTTLTVKADAAGTDAVALATDTLAFLGGANTGIATTLTDNTITISGVNATTSTKGVASFSSTSFDVTSGAVTIKAAGVSNAQLANKTITIGTTSTELGNTSTALAGLTELTVDNLNFNGNTITATDVNGGISLDPNGTGHVSVNNSRIENLADPVNPQDAATKAYVDGVSAGLHIHAAVKAATTGTLASITGGSVTYNNGTNGVGATLTLGVALTTLDGYTLLNGDRILVKNQATAAHNGIYTWATGGTVLTRATDFDTAVEIAGGDFTFVDNGTLFGNTGWVSADEVNTVGTDAVNFIQFSGAGTYLAGSGLTLNGNEFNVNLASNSGLIITSDELQVNSTIAGNGLTYSSGVLAVGAGTGITVNADTVQISASYAGQNTITTVGTIGTGVWQGSVIGSTYGGTGVNNGGRTLTWLTGNLTFTAQSGGSSVTVPATGTLATLANSETLTNKTINNSSIGSSNPGTAAFTTLTASGATTLTANTGSDSISNGTLVVTGGVGVGQNVWIGGSLNGSAGTNTLNGFTIDGGTF